MSTGRLLIVDDNEMNCDMLSRRLARKGYEVAVANDGYRALEMIRDQTFDLILLDIMMPGMSGLEVLERIRQTHSLTELPVLMATAKVDSEYVVQALSLGANDYVTKPIDFPVVLARIETQINVRQQLRDQAPDPAHSGPVLRTTGEFHRLEGTRRPEKIEASLFCDSCASALLDDHDTCPHCGAARPVEGWLPMSEADFPFLGQTIGERYFLEGYVGSGTDGIVYRARDIDLQRPFAAKLINTQEAFSGIDHDKMRQRVRLEVEAMVRLQNPHVVKLYEVVQVDATVFGLVMDYVQGKTVGSILEGGQQLRPELALEICRQVGQGLFEAHELGMIHRDIKPDNIMLEKLPAGGYFARVLDFGIVAILDRPSGSASFYGTPLYTSPEQIMEGTRVDHRADIYALGAVLFHMLTGRPPFVDSSVARILNLHVKAELPWIELAHLPDDVERAINDLTRRMMAKVVEDRPADLSEVIEDLNEILQMIPRTESGRMRRLTRATGPNPPAAAISTIPDEAISTVIGALPPNIEPILRTIEWSRSLAIRPQLSPNGTGLFAEVSKDGSLLHLVDFVSGATDKSVALVNAEVSALGISQRERLTAIADARTRQLCVVDMYDRGVVNNWSIPSAKITAVAISRDGSLAAAATHDGQLFIATAGRKKQAVRMVTGGASISAIAFSPRQTEIAVGATDGSVEIYPIATRGVRSTLDRLHAVPVCVAFNEGGDSIAALTLTGDVTTFLIQGGTRVAQVGFGQTAIIAVAFDLEHRLVGLIHAESRLQLWNLSRVLA